jgi:Flp pilus assembly protein TadG
MVPFIIVASMLVVQFGLAMYARQVLSGAVQDGAAHAALDGSTPGAGKTVTDQLVSQSGGHLIVNYSSTPSVTATTVTITAEADVVSLLPLFPAITVRAASSASLEAFRAAGS